MKGKLIMVLLVLAGICRGEESPFRIFTSAEGRVVEARIVDYNAGRNMLRIERVNGRKIWVSPTIFGEEDMAYIKEWVAAENFRSTSSFRIQGKKKSNNSSNSNRVEYELLLHNQSTVPVEKLRVEYRIYVKEVGYSSRKDSKRCVRGRISVGTLKAGEKISPTTEPEILAEQFKTVSEQVTTSDFYGNEHTYTSSKEVRTRKDRVEGVLFRIYGGNVGGKSVLRTYSIPSGFDKKVPWTP